MLPRFSCPVRDRSEVHVPHTTHAAAGRAASRGLLLRTLGDELKQNPLEIFSLLNLCTAGRAHENVTKKVDQIIGAVEKVWRKHLRKGVHDVIGPIRNNIPVMTIGAPDTLSWFKKMVNNEHLTRGAAETAISAKEFWARGAPKTDESA